MPGTTSGVSISSPFIIQEKSVYIPDAGLYLDSRKRKPLGFISHAHADHCARHTQIICSPPTAELLQVRYKNPNSTSIAFEEQFSLQKTEIMLYPAGHVLGSAQILISSAGGRLLYTGDFNAGASRTAEPFKLCTCDILIMETTYGNPVYRFPAKESVEDQLLTTIRIKMRDGLTPVIFAYPLGKAQEVLHLLSHNDIPVAVDYSIIKIVKVYQKYGISFGTFEKLRRSDFRGRTLLLPVGARFQKFVQEMQKKYTFYLSGWAMDPSVRFRFRVDRALPYSDHADYDQLLALVAASGASEIYCTHGSADFVTILRNEGYSAKVLHPPAQLNLFD